MDSLKETGTGKKKEPPFHKQVVDIIGEKANVVSPAIASSGSALSSPIFSRPPSRQFDVDESPTSRSVTPVGAEPLLS